MRSLWLTGLLIIIAGTSSLAKTPNDKTPRPQEIVFFDLRPDVDSSNRVLAVPGSEAVSILDRITSGTDEDLEAALKSVRNEISSTDNRWRSGRGGSIRVYIFYLDGKARINIDEKSRQSQLARDISGLAKAVMVGYNRGPERKKAKNVKVTSAG